MSDTRAAIRELRSLSEKRSTHGLTEQERSRLAELRERLGLPSEPAEVRSGGLQPGGTPAPFVVPVPPPAEPPSAATGAPVAAAALPRLDAADPAPLPMFESAPVSEPVQELVPEAGVLPAEPAPVLEPEPPVALAAPLPEPDAPFAAPLPEPDAPFAEADSEALEPTPAEAAQPEDALPLLTPPAQVTRFEVTSPSDAATDPAIELRALTEASSPPPEAEPDLAGEAPLPDLGGQDALPELEPAAAVMEAPPSDAVEPAPIPSDAPLASDDGSVWTAALLEVPTDGQEPVEALPAAQPEAFEPPADPEPVAPRRSLAERIDAAVEAGETLEAGDSQPADSSGWGATPVVAQAPVPEDLGAIPLDVADPAAEFGLGDDAAPIELSSADVILLEPETELGGEPADPVPLAQLHEFVGEQPADPRALAFDDQGGESTFSPEDLQTTEAELAAEPQAFQPGELESLPELAAEAQAFQPGQLESLPELEPEPPPPPPRPAAPHIVVPRPPSAQPPRPAMAPAPVPEPPARPPAPAPRAVTARTVAAPPPGGGARPATPPPPPAAAYVMGEDGRRLPALSAARPEPPQLAHQFANSGPFARNRAVLLAQAPLDVMEGAEGLVPEPPPPPPPATDVATGAEVFGGTYLSPTFVEGEHRVVLHTLEGQVRRGMVKDVDLLDPVIRLEQPGRPPEAIAAERVKAIFFMQEPGSPPPPSRGRRIRVGFSDGRQIVGFSEDVDGGEQGFFLVPADTRTHTARIYVFRAGVQSISPA